VQRHALVVRITHWLNALAILMLIPTGLNIFGAHPRLYWGDAGSVDQRGGQWLEIGVSGTARAPQGWVEVAGQRIDTTGFLGVSAAPSGRPSVVAFPHWATLPAMRDLATARGLHFLFAWVLIINGLVWLGHGLVSGRIAREILPRRDQLAPRHVWHDVVEHLRLRFPTGRAALSYEVLQRLAYAGVTLVLIPVAILTGMAMSPGLDAAFPVLDALWGGRQSARSVHFIAMAAITGFLALHLLLVLLSGPIRQLGAMITGRVRVEGAAP
jgi:thiosulfate reductase cytochrome b subunit